MKTSNASCLCFIRYTYPNLLKSSVNVMKYFSLFRVIVLKGPHTSVCMSPKRSEALSPIPVKGALVIFPHKQDSHTSKDS